ncbi:MAG: GFA family protein [Proteobacteria bacterium]|nr:GFA family protein [Pseudomonadota bacterium]
MADKKELYSGGCACGQAFFKVTGPPKRVGLCHCMTCRKAHASAFNPFVVFNKQDVELQGELRDWESSPGYSRRFCPVCGSRVASVRDTEIELSLGSFHSVSVLTPQYESWIIRRERWLNPLEVPQHERDAGASLS